MRRRVFGARADRTLFSTGTFGFESTQLRENQRSSTSSSVEPSSSSRSGTAPASITEMRTRPSPGILASNSKDWKYCGSKVPFTIRILSDTVVEPCVTDRYVFKPVGAASPESHATCEPPPPTPNALSRPRS